MLRIVVLPQPDGPRMHTNPPGRTSKDTLRSASIRSPRAFTHVRPTPESASFGSTISGGSGYEVSVPSTVAHRRCAGSFDGADRDSLIAGGTSRPSRSGPP